MISSGKIKVIYKDCRADDLTCGQTVFDPKDKVWIIVVNSKFRKDPSRVAAILSHEFWHVFTDLQVGTGVPNTVIEELDAYSAEIEMYAILKANNKYFNQFYEDVWKALSGDDKDVTAFCRAVIMPPRPGIKVGDPGYKVKPRPTLPENR